MAMNGDTGLSVFAQYIDAPKEEGRPAANARHPLGSRQTPIEKLLDWLVNYWGKTTVTAREIYIYGPNCVRDRPTTLNLAQTLVERGWLVPIKPRGPSRRDKREWKIVCRAESVEQHD
jgi:hypothetical protein